MGGSGTAGEMPRTAREHSNLGKPPQRVVADPTTAMEDGMKAWISLVLGGLILGAGPSSALGQGLGGSLHVGTLGLGARVAIPVGGQVNLRGGVDFQPITIETDLSDVKYDLNLPSPSFTGLLDWHPGGGGFRASGGIVYFTTGLELEGRPIMSVDIGSEEYTPSELGSLVGSLGTSPVAPYLGLG